MSVAATSVTHLLCPVAGTACPRQGLQSLAPVDGWYELIGQRHCCDAPKTQNIPGEHLLHDDAPGVAEYVPDVQAMQAVEDEALLNLPAGQGAQYALPSAELNVPGAQGSHADELEEPLFGLYDPAWQGSQYALPSAELKYPGGQVSHADGLEEPLSGLYDPAGQGAQDVLPAKLKYPGGQVSHADGLAEPLFGL